MNPNHERHCLKCGAPALPGSEMCFAHAEASERGAAADPGLERELPDAGSPYAPGGDDLPELYGENYPDFNLDEAEEE